MKSEDVARICHAANNAFRSLLGEVPKEPWENCSDELRDSAIDGVDFKVANPKVTAAQMHENWCKAKKEQGWKYGEEENAFRKTHPCLVKYKDLPAEQRLKDDLFSAIVGALHSDD